MAAQYQDRTIQKIIVKNLPEKWSSDHLMNFLEVETSLGILEIEKAGPCLAQILLDSPVSEETISRSSYGLKPFCGQTLTLEVVQESPLSCCSLLVHYPDPAITRDHLMLCLDDIGEVLDCQTHAQTCLAFVQFQSPEDAQAVLKTSDLRISGKPLQVEPWVERIHRSLLQPLLCDGKAATPSAVSNACEQNRRGSPPTPMQVDYKRFRCNFGTAMQACDLSSEENHTAGVASDQNHHDGCRSENFSLPKGNHNDGNNNNERHDVHYNVKARSQPVAGLTPADKDHKGQLTNFTVDKTLQSAKFAARGPSTESKKSNLEQTDDESSNPLCPKREKASQRPPARFLEPESKGLEDLDELMKALSLGEAESSVRDNSREDVAHLESEIHRLQQQLAAANKQSVAQPVVLCVDVPRHRIRPLKEFMDKSPKSYSNTVVTFFETKGEGKVVFAAATEEECIEANERFCIHFEQNVIDKTIPVSEEVMNVLKKEGGRRYLDVMISRNHRCGIDVRDTCISCAALLASDIEAFEREFDSRFITKTLQIPINVIIKPEFRLLKNDLEQNHLVAIALPTDFSTSCYTKVKVDVAGLSQDVNLAVDKLEEFSSRNRNSDSVFVVDGKLQGKAVRLWFQREMEQAKLLISKNGEILSETNDQNGYCMKYRCSQQILPSVVQKLDVIRKDIVHHTYDLNNEFAETIEYILVVNGLLDVGIGHFADRFKGQLERDHLKGLVDFVVPRKCHIPRFDRPSDKGMKATTPERGDERGGQRGRDEGARSHPRGRGQGSGGGRRESRPFQLPYSLTVGKTVVTLRSGDITCQQVEAALSVIGEELEMETCALGKAFMVKCPQLAQMLTSSSNGKASKGPGTIFATEVPKGSNLIMSVIFHALLTKQDSRTAVEQIVQKSVLSCLKKTAKRGLKSIALPPLGVGRKFGYGRYTTALAMMTSVQEFLSDKPDAIKDITIVVGDDKEVQEKFAQALQKTIGSAEAREDTPNDGLIDKAKILWQKGIQKVAALMHIAKEPSTTPEILVTRNRFQATIYTTKTTDITALKDKLVKILRKTFLHCETIEEKDCIGTLKESIDNVVKQARDMNVIITHSKKGGLTVSGQRERVAQVVAIIRKEMFVGLDQRQKADQSARQHLSLPTDTDRLPSYWTVRQKDHRVTYKEAIESWQQRGVRTNKVTDAEFTAVKRLVSATWDGKNVGDGADARGLTHSGITVVAVKRLENPVLWKEYSHRRDQMIDDLVRYHRASHPTRCSPVDQLPGSRGPVLTTRQIKKGDPLARDIFPVEINEHYLFHGTKKEIVGKIYNQGLDFRLNSNGMLGKGVYLAECPTKSDQYADSRDQRSRPGETLTMLLVRVLLGHPYLHKAQTPTQFKRPPCMACQDEFCRCRESKRTSRFYGSVIDDCRLFREFVVYGEHLCYPEYVISYKRDYGRASIGGRRK